MNARQNIAVACIDRLQGLSQLHNPAYANVNACINNMNEASKTIKKASGVEQYAQQLALEQNIALALLTLYKQPIPQRAGIKLFQKSYTDESKKIRQQVESIAENYFVSTNEKKKLSPEETVQALVAKCSITERLTHYLHTSDDNMVKIERGFNQVDAETTWPQYNHAQQKLLSSVIKQDEFIILEAMIEGKIINQATKHHFTARKDEADLARVIIPALGLLTIGLNSSRGNVNSLEAANMFSRALTDGVKMKENSENNVWEVSAALPATNISRTIIFQEDGEKSVNNKEFDSQLKESFNSGIEHGENADTTVHYACFVEPKTDTGLAHDEAKQTNRVFVYSVEQAAKFKDFLQTHPHWFDKEEGWQLSRYQDNLIFKHQVINQLCDILDELNQEKDKTIVTAITHAIADFRRYQSAEMKDVMTAFAQTKQFCEQLIHLDNKPGEHPLDKCLSQMQPQFQWLHDVIARKGNVSGQQDVDIQMDMAVIALKDFTPGLLVQQMGDKPVTKHNVEAAYVACLKDYLLNGQPKTAAEFTKVQDEYEFLSHPFQLKAWSERVSQAVASEVKSDVEMISFRK